MADVSLKTYLASLVDRRWKPGTLDCGVFMADWVRLVCAVDPIADVRGRYSTESGFRRILRREGGFEKSCAARLAAVGYAATDTPRGGDLAVVLAAFAVRKGKTLRRPTGAICVSERMSAVMTSDLGIIIADHQLLPVIGVFRYHG